MGNTNSNANAQHSSNRHSRRFESPHRLGGARTQSPAPASSSSSTRQSQSPVPGSQPPQPHKSLRAKKRSLELPDLAQLSLTPVYASPPSSARASPHGRRGPRTSSPIPIPVTSANARAIAGSERRGRYGTFSDVQIDAIAQPTRGRSGQRYEDQEQQQRQQQQQQQQEQMMYVQQDPRMQGFVPEIVNSTIPIHLRQVDGDATTETAAPSGVGDTSIARNPLAPEIIKEVNTPIRWRGGGKSVYLARAGDNNWKGRQQMTLEDPDNDQVWITHVSLLPGTHHIKFVVDESWRIADDLPKAVDDDGSLANYVNVINPYTSAPPSAWTSAAATAVNSPLLTPNPNNTKHGHESFWSATSDAGSSFSGPGPVGSRPDAEWTSTIPPELIVAAREEENYLSSSSTTSDSSSAPPSAAHAPPSIPPAPWLPRHLDKLILNVKPHATTAHRTQRDRDREREERRSQRSRSSATGSHNKSQLGMTVTNSEDLAAAAAIAASATAQTQVNSGDIPVTTASGTDVTDRVLPHHTSLVTSQKVKIDASVKNADDNSVLPVPSHVVLHHLCTSAIKNGVLAVGSTTRYRKKYLTTIYYKPT